MRHLPHRALEPIFSRGILLFAPQLGHLTIADVDSFIHPSLKTLTDSRAATVHENYFFVLELFCQLSRLSQICRLKNTIDIRIY